MTIAPSIPAERKLHMAAALGRGFLGRCPNCGKGKLLKSYISPIADCAVCHEHLEPYQTADFAPYIVTFVIGILFTPPIVALSMVDATNLWLPILFGLAAVTCALLLLPRVKGSAIALLWALDIQVNV